MDVTLRPVQLDDAGVLAQLLRENREHLARWEPRRGEQHLTEAGQRTAVAQRLTAAAQGREAPFVVLLDGAVVGTINVNDVVRGAFQSAHLGYWLAQPATGRGVATAAVALAVRHAFGELGLHRLQADTLVDNTASRRVLAKSGFVEVGRAPRYLQIAGRWQDCVLHQLLHEGPGTPWPDPTIDRATDPATDAPPAGSAPTG